MIALSSILCEWMLRVVVTALQEECQAQIEMGRRPYEVGILWFDADAIYEFGHFVGERSSYDGVCMQGADGGIDGHTYLCRRHAAADSNVGVEEEGKKGHLGFGPALQANDTNERRHCNEWLD